MQYRLCVRDLVPLIPSNADPLLVVWIFYNQRNKHVENTVFNLFRLEGMPNRLVPNIEYLKNLAHD